MNDRLLTFRFVIPTILLAMLMLSLTIGCRSQKHPADITACPLAPADFQLQFHVKNPSTQPIANPLTQTSQTILQNDRSLRVAVGPGATTDYYPGTTRRLEPQEIDRLWQFLRQENLLGPSASPASQPSLPTDGQVVYDLKILLGNQTIRHMAIAGNHPAMDHLARYLLVLRSGAIPPSLENSPRAEAP